MQDGTFFQFSRNFYRKLMFQMASEAKKEAKMKNTKKSFTKWISPEKKTTLGKEMGENLL